MAKVRIYFSDLSEAKQDELKELLKDELAQEIKDLIKNLKCDEEYATKEAIRSHLVSYDEGMRFQI